MFAFHVYRIFAWGDTVGRARHRGGYLGGGCSRHPGPVQGAGHEGSLVGETPSPPLPPGGGGRPGYLPACTAPIAFQLATPRKGTRRGLKFPQAERG